MAGRDEKDAALSMECMADTMSERKEVVERHGGLKAIPTKLHTCRSHYNFQLKSRNSLEIPLFLSSTSLQRKLQTLIFSVS